jgi:ribosome-associated protein
LRYSLGFGRLLHYIRLIHYGVGQNCTSRTPRTRPQDPKLTSQPPRKPADEEPFEYDGPSKSSRKRAAHAAQDLGEELIRMRDSDLNQLNLPERVVEAIHEARRITSRGGGARQRQYIGKLMRDVDLEPIYTFIASRSKLDAQETERFKRVEAWRERLIVEGAPALDELERWRPGLDRAELARHLSAAQEERTRTGVNGAAGRELFRVLRALFMRADEGTPE